MIKKIIVLIPLALFTACSSLDYSRKAGLATTSNTERNFVIDYGDGKKHTLVQRCLEAPGPATALNDFSFNPVVSAKTTEITEGEISLDLSNTESLAKLYEVSSILQYAHAMTYRLCEAGLNRHVGNDEYMGYFEKIIESTESLLGKQLELEQEATKQLEAEARIKEAGG